MEQLTLLELEDGVIIIHDPLGRKSDVECESLHQAILYRRMK